MGPGVCTKNYLGLASQARVFPHTTCHPLPPGDPSSPQLGGQSLPFSGKWGLGYAAPAQEPLSCCQEGALSRAPKTRIYGRSERSRYAGGLAALVDI